MNKIIISILITFLLAFSVNIVSGLGEPCLNDVDCTGSEVCQGYECRAADITALLDALKGDEAPPECADDDDDCTDDDLPYCNVYDDCVECIRDSDCDDDEECEDYECVTEEEEECDSDSDCSSDQFCDVDTCEDICNEDWKCESWTACVLGKQTTTCWDINDCGTENFRPTESKDCTVGAFPTCYDGIMNQGETRVDCGGPCSTCEDCYDEIQNQGEEDVDCGGPCPTPCSVIEAGKSPSFWIIFTTILIVLLLITLGLWYFKIKKGAEGVGKQVDRFTRRPPTQPGGRPPTQPSSLLRI